MSAEMRLALHNGSAIASLCSQWFSHGSWVFQFVSDLEPAGSVELGFTPYPWQVRQVRVAFRVSYLHFTLWHSGNEKGFTTFAFACRNWLGTGRSFIRHGFPTRILTTGHSVIIVTHGLRVTDPLRHLPKTGRPRLEKYEEQYAFTRLE